MFTNDLTNDFLKTKDSERISEVQGKVQNDG